MLEYSKWQSFLPRDEKVSNNSSASLYVYEVHSFNFTCKPQLQTYKYNLLDLKI